MILLEDVFTNVIHFEIWQYISKTSNICIVIDLVIPLLEIYPKELIMVIGKALYVKLFINLL